MRDLPRPVLVLVAVLVAAAVWNAAYEVVVPVTTRSFRVHQSDELHDLVDVEQLSLGPRFDIYLLLAEVGRDRILVAPPRVLSEDRLDGLADMRLETDEDGPEPDRDQLERLLAMPGLEGTFGLAEDDRERSLHVIAPAPGDTRLRLIITEGWAVVAGQSTLDEVMERG